MKALTFGVDGTLAETEELHRPAFNEAFAAAGLPWSWDRDRYRALLATTGGKERIDRFMPDEGLDTAVVDVAALHADKTARYGALMAAGAIAQRPGLRDLIEAAAAQGRKLAAGHYTSHEDLMVTDLSQVRLADLDIPRRTAA